MRSLKERHDEVWEDAQSHLKSERLLKAARAFTSAAFLSDCDYAAFESYMSAARIYRGLPNIRKALNLYGAAYLAVDQSHPRASVHALSVWYEMSEMYAEIGRYDHAKDALLDMREDLVIHNTIVPATKGALLDIINARYRQYHAGWVAGGGFDHDPALSDVTSYERIEEDLEKMAEHKTELVA